MRQCCFISLGKLFTLFMIDVDVSSPTFGTRALPLIHWSLINIEDGDISTGTAAHDYIGPLPPSGVHLYSFLLYEQTQLLSVDGLLQHAGSVPECSGFLENR